jgi:RNA polymerase sigma-70 factor (ECF subfamily)
MTKERSNQDWLNELAAPAEPGALDDLRKLLLRGLRAALSNKIDEDLETVTEDFAQDALLKILDNLDSFRGESRFTTWAQKIAINVAFSELRRRRWKDISLQTIIETPDGDEFTPTLLTDPGNSPERKISQVDIMGIVEELVHDELTDRQRTAMLAMLNSDIPLAEVARQLDTNPNALYKLMHDARQRLKVRLEERTGLSALEVMELFEEPVPENR